MSRRARMVLASAFVALAAGTYPVAGQEVPGAQKPGAAAAPPGAMSAWSPGLYGVPGYWMLGTEHVQRELGLTGEQKQKLRTIAQEYQKKQRQEWEKIRRLSPEEQRKHWTEQREKMNQQIAEIRKQVEAALLPDQITRFKEVVFRTRAAALMANPKTLEELDLSEEQRGRLRKIREEIQQKMQKLQQESIDKTLGVLTPEQQARIRGMSNQGQQF